MKMKRFIAIAISLMMVLATSVAAFATPGPTGPGTITVTNPHDGDTYSFYRVLDLNYVNGAYSYTINSNWEAFFAAVTPALPTIPAGMPGAGNVSPAAAYEYIMQQMEGIPQVGTAAVYYTQEEFDQYVADNGYEPTWHVGDVKTPASADYAAEVPGRPADFARELAAYARANSIAADYTINAEPWSANVTYGWYLMIPSGPYASAVFSLTSIAPNETITNKSTYPTVEKTVTDIDEINTDSNVAGVGDELVFTLTSAVPNMAGYTVYDFSFVDVMENLTFVPGSVKLTIGGEVIDVPAANITWDSATKTLTVVVPNMLTYTAGDAIVLQYKATVDAEAVVGNPGNTNTATVVYSNNPNNTSSHATSPADTTKTFVLEIDLTKVNSAGETLTGSTWRLEKYVNGAWVAVNVGTLPTATADQTAASANSALFDGSGDPLFVWSNLDEGTYRLIELTAPDGYTLIEDPIEFTIDATEDATNGITAITFNCTSSYIQGTPVTTAADGTIEFNIKNLTQSELPGTGGIGVGILVAAAALGLGGFGAVALKKKKDEKED